MSCSTTRDIYLNMKPNTYSNRQLSRQDNYTEQSSGCLQASSYDVEAEENRRYAIPQYQLAPQNQQSVYTAYAEAYAEMLPADVVEMPEAISGHSYTPDYLRANMGSLVRVEFLLGNSMIERIGFLSEVGASYIVLDPLEGSGKMMCDIFSIKFVTVMELHA